MESAVANSVENVTSIPITYQIGKPINIHPRNLTSLLRFVNNWKKLPRATSCCFDSINIRDSNTLTRAISNNNPIPPPTKYDICHDSKDDDTNLVCETRFP